MKYNLDQVIHYMRDNKPHSAPVLARRCIENLFPWISTAEQMKLFTPFGSAGVCYATCHGIVDESEAFASREEMFEAMK